MPPEWAQEFQLEDAPDGRPNTWLDISDTQRVKVEALCLHARHIADAREMIAQLEKEPRTVATLHRAWPPVPPGERVSGFLQ